MRLPEFRANRNELIRQVGKDLDASLGFCGSDIYFTGLSLYPDFKMLRTAFIYTKEDQDAVVDDNGNLHFGFREETLTARLKSRFIERFDLNRFCSQGSGITFAPFAFAHELGHVIQFDPNFNAYFGPIDQHLILPKDDYSLYVESDLELNADYIAAAIVGNSNFGRELGFVPPSEEPIRWRDWGLRHPVTRTIELYHET